MYEDKTWGEYVLDAQEIAVLDAPLYRNTWPMSDRDGLEAAVLAAAARIEAIDETAFSPFEAEDLHFKLVLDRLVITGLKEALGLEETPVADAAEEYLRTQNTQPR